MIGPPIAALCFGSEVFFPVAMTSIVGAVICLIFRALNTQIFVGQVTAELVCDLASADTDRRELVLSELNAVERKLFLAKIARMEAETHFGRDVALRRPPRSARGASGSHHAYVAPLGGADSPPHLIATKFG